MPFVHYSQNLNFVRRNAIDDAVRRLEDLANVAACIFRDGSSARWQLRERLSALDDALDKRVGVLRRVRGEESVNW